MRKYDLYLAIMEKIMYEPHPEFIVPDDDKAKLWRYMDFTKLIDLFYSSELHFSRSDKLGDPLEGSISALNEKMWESYIEELPSDGVSSVGFPNTIPKQGRLLLRQSIKEFRQSLTKKIYISCWHMNAHESAAMWRLYGTTNESIALQTTWHRLSHALPDFIFCGKVQYASYEEDIVPEGNALLPFLYKRRSFEHEHELRAFLWNLYQAPEDTNVAKSIEDEKWVRINSTIRDSAARIPINLSELIEKIYINPASPAWFSSLVAESVRRAGLNIPVHQSSLNTSPIY